MANKRIGKSLTGRDMRMGLLVRRAAGQIPEIRATKVLGMEGEARGIISMSTTMRDHGITITNTTIDLDILGRQVRGTETRE